MVNRCENFKGSFDVDEKLNYSAIQKVREDKDIEEQRIHLFHIKIQIKKIRFDCIIDLGS